MSTQMFDLTGKIALVTGSGRGIGFTLARGLGRAGASVVLNDVNAELLAEAAEKLADEGIAVDSISFDVTDSKAIEAGVAEIEKRHGRIDILVNNAGIQRRYPLEEFPEEEWNAVINLNLTAVFKMSKAVAKGMIARKYGKIVNICSANSAVARPTIGAYCAAKGALVMLNRSMATEWSKHNITANGIGPGYFDTEMTAALVNDKEFTDWICKRCPAGRWGDPQELVGTAIFLASDASSFVNGQLIFVDGGLLSAL